MTLTVENLSVAIGGRAVLGGVSFAAERGELIVIAGPNGAGKTTLLRAIASLIPFSGSILWEGASLAAMPPQHRAHCLAYLPQGHVAHWPIPARDVVAIGRAPFASSLARLSDADYAAIDAALAAVEATAFADRPVTELSGGERARVMLARALAVGAPVLLADEPVAALDPAHQLSVMAILVERAKAGDLVIAVGHDLALAARFASRVLVLDAGRVAAFGPPAGALTPDVLRRVFNVEALTVEAGGVRIPLPWTIADGARR